MKPLLSFQTTAFLSKSEINNRHQRPRSLHLSSKNKEEIELTYAGEELLRPQFEELGSLPNLNEDFGVLSAIRPNLARQISASSMEKVKKLKQHIQRVMNPLDSVGDDSLDSSIEDTESSPLVVSTPVVIINKSNDASLQDKNNESKNGGKTPTQISPTKPHSPTDRETHV